MKNYSDIRGEGLAFLFLLWSMWLMVMLVRSILGPLLPMIEDEFVVSHAKATVLVSLFALGAAPATFATGIFAGRMGYKKTILLCLALMTAVFLLITNVRSYPELAVLFFAFGAVWGMYFPCVIPIVTAHFTPSVWGRVLAIQDTGASISVLGAPLLTVLMIRFLTWRQFFYVFAIAYVIPGILFLLFAKEVKVEKARKSRVGGLLAERSVWVLGALWILATASFMGIYQVTPLYFTKELMFGADYANTILSLSRIGGIAFGVFMGFMADRFNVKRGMFAVLCLSGLFTMLVGHPNHAVLQIALFLQGTMIMGFFSLGLVALSRMFEMAERSVASALVATMGAIVGSGIVPYLLGLSGDHLSFRFGLVVFGGVVALGSGLVFLLRIPGPRER